jgi:hypothetical protein
VTAIEWMNLHGDATDHAIASQWMLLPETTDGDRARWDLIQSQHMRFARARIEADLLTAQAIVGRAI